MDEELKKYMDIWDKAKDKIKAKEAVDKKNAATPPPPTPEKNEPGMIKEG